MPPFTVLHVCMGNICRSPMAERLLVAAAVDLVGKRQPDLIYSTSAGTGGWHQGEPMNPPAARQVRARGGSDAGFTASKLKPEYLDAADLVLTATIEQADYVVEVRPDAGSRTFVLGEFGRYLPEVDLTGLPPSGPDPDGVYARGVALVEAVDAIRAGRPARPEDEVDDPWGRGDGYFERVANEIDAVVRPLATALLK